MKTATRSLEMETEIWLRILHPDRELTPKVARALLGLAFSPPEIARMGELSAKARAGNLTPEEDEQMDDIERAGAILSTLKSKARQVLKLSPQKS
ncbi:MAG TPA: hypothetical protein VHR66_10880 [Gemmataceae bacterium]|nr:hypothetical protein [Gemmataceae bacterium]